MRNYIIIHHSATKNGNVEIFRKAHKAKGWRNVGYHYVIGNGTNSGDGQIEKGRAETETGAHCSAGGMNTKGIGICLVGDFETQRPTAKQMQSLEGLVRDIMSRWKIPAENVLGHREVGGAATLCPGKNFDTKAFRGKIEKKGDVIFVCYDGQEFEGLLVNGKAYVEVRKLCEMMGLKVIWNGKEKRVDLKL